MKLRTQHLSALSLVEVLFVLATIAILVVVLLPAFQRTTSRRSRIGCTASLKQIGLAYRLYSNDHDDKFPFAVSTTVGGTLEFINSPQVALHFQSMSNELVTPKILVCPNDPQRVRTASFLAPLNNKNISYFVGLDADESKPERILSGDRNITGGTLSNGFLRLLKTNTSAGWTREIHNKAGNIGLADGSVMQTTPETLRKQLQRQTLPLIRLAIP